MFGLLISPFFDSRGGQIKVRFGGTLRVRPTFTPAGWELAPAFDLNPSLSKNHLTLTYGDGYRDITPEALLKHSSDWSIPSDIAEKIAYETVQSIARWKDEAQSAGISEAQIKMMQPAFTEHFDCI